VRRYAESDIDFFKYLGPLGLCLGRVGAAVTVGQVDVVGERVSSARGYNGSTRTTLISAHNTTSVAAMYKNANIPNTSANTALVALALLTTCPM
jgi:hypothetical protein